jgi:acyl-CoA synthetase (AMP-forming)/AMP-acid ligase II
VLSRLNNVVSFEPSRPALIHGQHSFSYGELAETLSSRASDLERQREDTHAHFLPLVVNRSIDSAVSVLAAIAYRIPIALIDESLPDKRQMENISRLSHGQPSEGAYGSELSREQVSKSLANDEPLACEGFVVFTSGSTGRPKGVVLSYDKLDWRLGLLEQSRRSRPGPHTIAQFKPFHFSAGLTMLAHALIGHTVHILDPRGHSIGDLWRYLFDAKVTFLSLAPSLARVIAQSSELFTLPDVSYFSIGGEGARFELLDPFRQVFTPDTTFVHGLGFSEGFRPMRYEKKLGDARRTGPIPLGSITRREQVCLVESEHLVGHQEVWVSGPIAEGYLDDPVLTEEKFVFSDGRRWWKSGDLVTEVESEIFRHAGRVDDLIKISGMLTCPSETASYIMTFPGVRDVAVVPDPTNGNRLVAHIERNPEADLNKRTLIDWLEQLLPSNQIPRNVVLWEQLPTMVGGKIDRQALTRYSNPIR